MKALPGYAEAAKRPIDCSGSAATGCNCYVLAFDCKPGKALGANAEEEVSRLCGRKEARPLNDEGFSADYLRRQVAVSEFNIGPSVAGDQLGPQCPDQ
jgi:hypothetical protein